MTTNGTAALAGLKVVEFAQLVAGPMAGSMLADLGAEVVHVEDPESGDPLRRIRAERNGVHPWWKVMARNKRSATLNLRVPEGQELARSLIRWADVVVTNNRPGTMERWGLDFEHARAVNPTIIMAHVTGFGLTSSQRDAPGFGKVGEAMSGVVHLTGFPDGPPVHTGFSHGDTLAGVFAALGVQAALYRRSVDPDFAGELVDLALFEPLFRLVDWQIAEQDLDRRVEAWIAERTGDEVVATLKPLGIVAWKIYDAGDILDDPTYAERGDVLEMEDADLGSIRMPDVVPRLTYHRGRVWRTAPALGADNDLVYREYLGIGPS